MIFYNIDNITIGKYLDIILDINCIKRIPIWMPKKLINKKFEKLKTDYALIVNEKEMNSRLIDAFDKVSLINQANNLYPALYHGFQACYKISALSGKIPPIMKDLEIIYKDATGKDATMELINNIPTKIEKITSAFDMMNNDIEPETFDFSLFIIKLSALIHPLTVLDKKLKHLNKYVELAISTKKSSKTE